MAFLPVIIIFHFLLFQGVVPSSSSSLGGDRKALMEFAKNVVVPGAAPRRLKGWSMKAPICKSWVGVHCSSSNSSDGSHRRRRRVVGVNLGGYGIRGAIPEKTIGRLDALETLYLENNNLTGAIPADLTTGNLPKLKHLNLSNNRLNGCKPSSLSKHFPPSSFANNSFICGPTLNRHRSPPGSQHQQPPLNIGSVDHKSSSASRGAFRSGKTTKKTHWSTRTLILVYVFGSIGGVVGTVAFILLIWYLWNSDACK